MRMKKWYVFLFGFWFWFWFFCLLIMKDKIFSYAFSEIYAIVEYERVFDFDFYYEGIILESNFPQELVDVIDEYNQTVREVAISILDDIEVRFYSYDLRLEKNDSRIFDFEIQDTNKISFFGKYPSSQGFLDDFPFRR